MFNYLMKGMKNSKLPIAVTLLTVLTACSSGGSDEPTPTPTPTPVDENVSVDVKFGWSGADGGSSSSKMAFVAFADGASPVQVAFNGSNGGTTKLAPKTYSFISYNSDTQTLSTRGTTWNTFEIYSKPTSLANVSKVFENSSSIPRSRGAENEEVISEPSALFTSALQNVTLTKGQSSLSLDMSMETATKEYSFTISNVENLSYAAEAVATLSGMSGSWMPALHQASASANTIPFELSLSGDKIVGKVRSFGSSASSSSSQDKTDNLLTVYVEMKDGSKVYSTINVSEVVQNASSQSGSTDLPVNVDGLKLPAPVEGVQPSVNEWINVTQEIKM